MFGNIIKALGTARAGIGIAQSQKGLGRAFARGMWTGATSVFRGDPIYSLGKGAIKSAAGGRVPFTMSAGGKDYLQTWNRARYSGYSGELYAPGAKGTIGGVGRGVSYKRHGRFHADMPIGPTRNVIERGPFTYANNTSSGSHILPSAMKNPAGQAHQIASLAGAGVGVAGLYGGLHATTGMNLIHFGALMGGHFAGTGGYRARLGKAGRMGAGAKGFGTGAAAAGGTAILGNMLF